MKLIYIAGPCPVTVSGVVIQRALQAAAIVLGVRQAQLASRTRTQPVADARAIVAWILTRGFLVAPTRAALYLSRHHTTVVYAADRVDADIANGGPLRAALMDVIELMEEQSRHATAERSKQ